MIKNALDEKTIQTIKQKMSEGLLPQWVLSDPQIHELELQKIFGHTWQFLAHESELKESGSYVTRWMADDPVLVVRNSKGEIKAFLNSCTHRGTHLCTADFGNKKTFTCPYHGWSYNLDGDLIGIVAGNKVYGQEMKKDEWGLRPIPKIGIYRGMIFGNLDPHAIPLTDYLGDMKWYFDILLGRSDGGMEVRGVPQRWVAQANWKMTSENFAADPYHVQTTHRSTVEMGISPKDPLYAGYGHQVVLGHGHGINVITSATGQSAHPFQGMPESMWPMFKRNLNPEQFEILSKTTVFVGGVFPNLSFVSPVHGTEGHLHNYLNFRVWRPLGPDKVEVWCWFMIDKAAPEEYKEEAYKGYIGSFGPSGTLEQDDTEIWARVVQASKGIMARDKTLSYNNVFNYLMGFDRVEPDENFPGPGVAYPTCYLDALSRSMHEYWLEMLTRDLHIEGGENH
ncbi:aromatic ring-hydroxylating dioxygenase subunit alpha [Paenactinomyces guangxiensis]|uniref:Aromatic ring-hydroxylating dioxygenase subunit alpha n=1 Tax=Paenactinomyces guangxiensis TaxID=1490290 RepID=A0A7W2A7H7_9BACL|nr:aromatic ring-hydroxylating dioxygenase subunit alpha [Paenactinomyces guangxiensis]MBA4493565.1 aromatic ring-hydroxylating dioxygenase subunit alpha [Paenactinomyces guangxiensis]MBH8590656.1 aromatic ring-hydroxylating dioxygenase subunit alpha [Paenactinomyces guangxiensis]